MNRGRSNSLTGVFGVSACRQAGALNARECVSACLRAALQVARYAPRDRPFTFFSLDRFQPPKQFVAVQRRARNAPGPLCRVLPDFFLTRAGTVSDNGSHDTTANLHACAVVVQREESDGLSSGPWRIRNWSIYYRSRLPRGTSRAEFSRFIAPPVLSRYGNRNFNCSLTLRSKKYDNVARNVEYRRSTIYNICIISIICE